MIQHGQRRSGNAVSLGIASTFNFLLGMLYWYDAAVWPDHNSAGWEVFKVNSKDIDLMSVHFPKVFCPENFRNI